MMYKSINQLMICKSTRDIALDGKGREGRDNMQSTRYQMMLSVQLASKRSQYEALGSARYHEISQITTRFNKKIYSVDVQTRHFENYETTCLRTT